MTFISRHQLGTFLVKKELIIHILLWDLQAEHRSSRVHPKLKLSEDSLCIYWAFILNSGFGKHRQQRELTRAISGVLQGSFPQLFGC